NQELARFPDKPVKPGDTWERTSEANIGGGQTLTFQTRYKYDGTIERNGKTLDRISSVSTEVSYAMDQNAQSPLKITGSELKITSSDGLILFDRERGVTVETS